MTLNLAQTLSWTKSLAALNPDAAAELAMLNDLQGNILKGHGRNFTSNLFVAFDPNKQTAAKAFVASLAPDVTTALDQLTKPQVFKVSGVSGGTFIAAMLSSSGYDALGQTTAKPEGDAFRAGMKARKLEDPEPAMWDECFSQTVDAMLLIAADSADMRDRERDAMVARITATDDAVRLLNPRFKEDGNALFNDDGIGIEHFGYVDGRSQPLPLTEDVDEEKNKRGGISAWDPSIPLSQVLVKCPGGNLEVSHGSFFVFRKLEQNVKAFKEREKEISENLAKHHDKDPEAIDIGANVVGRFENGTPIVGQTAPSASSMPVPGTGVSNNFNYAADPDGLECPFAGHIRKTNPRTDTPDSKTHLMARRGIPYGVRTDKPNSEESDDKPTGNVGLLFMAYQSSLENQFEFTQQKWVNNAGFRRPDTGIDPLIGQPKGPSKQKWVVEYGKVLSDGRPEDEFSGFVTMQGGEYFFAPSISFFKSLLR
ncbi:hypothetical protein BTH42_33915 [Burkholderia sp. SRS-W-2-2016]|uniref:Dyp-type peroxidase n=1 Tax=Burkholderia sp. SRS-W-2-2016 TaxID=1926878 RepID=UPI00094B0DB3|nr:Dyp-type peroxidase [Burkholderia sp. SRS-W-2-2016]OLL27227.1 hypothetical protein BTH42_33915 [Burkholderia sp. SRS-W-2-2016]